jgi:pseudaminic acid synthase
MELGGRIIGAGMPPMVIAEMSGNHNQSLDRALAIVDAAADAGAHALKIQTYTPDTMTLDKTEGEFCIDNPNSLWNGTSLHQLYQQAFTPWEWHAPILERSRQRGMIAFSTPFDESAVDHLEDLNVPCYKVASFENTDLPLLRKVAKTGKPLIISTGMATLAELDEMVETIRRAGCSDFVLLKCTSTYPATPEHSNIRTIPHLRDLFGCEVGLSDHTMGIGAAVAAVALGATVIEKHFTLRRSDGGVDSTFSMEPAEMRSLVIESEAAWKALGDIRYGPTTMEKDSLIFRRSIYAVTEICAGDIFTKDNLRVIRPGLGLPAKYYDIFLGKRSNQDIAKGTPLKWDMIG